MKIRKNLVFLNHLKGTISTFSLSSAYLNIFFYKKKLIPLIILFIYFNFANQ